MPFAGFKRAQPESFPVAHTTGKGLFLAVISELRDSPLRATILDNKEEHHDSHSVFELR